MIFHSLDSAARHLSGVLERRPDLGDVMAADAGADADDAAALAEVDEVREGQRG